MSVIRLLIADDSPVFVDAFSHLIESDPNLKLVGTASDGLRAHQLAEQLRPDIITMDIHMPGLDGLGAIERIMSTVPTPILVLTGDPRSQDSRGCFEALSRGALELLPKPDFYAIEGAAGRHLCERIRLLAGVSVIHHARPVRVEPSLSPPMPPKSSLIPGVVVIGASTGGPAVLSEVLGMLPANFPLPIALVQHLASGFAPHFAAWLNDCCALKVRTATQNAPLTPGEVLLAPDDRHLSLHSRASISLVNESPDAHYCPSVDVLFRTAASTFGSSAVGVVLTGMGRDGAEGLMAMRAAGAVTIAQSGASCTVDGMPQAARDSGAAAHVLHPSGIAMTLLNRARELSLSASA